MARGGANPWLPTSTARYGHHPLAASSILMISSSSTSTASSLPLHSSSSRRRYAIHTFSPPAIPNDEKPVPRVVERDTKALLHIFNVPLDYRYQTTPRWRETPAVAHRRAQRKKLSEMRKRSRVYVDVLEARETQRLREEREQMERWKALRLQTKRADWKLKMEERARVEAIEREARLKARQQNRANYEGKLQVHHTAKREWLRAINEELHKFDTADLPHLINLKNYKYDTWENTLWYTTEN